MLGVLFYAALLILPGDHRLDQYGIETPPSAYTHTPTKPVFRIEVPFQDINKTCWRDPPSDFIAGGCTKWTRTEVIRDLIENPLLPQVVRHNLTLELLNHTGAICVIVVPQLNLTTSLAFQHSVWKHELAHCNGLVHDASGLGWYDRRTYRRVPQD